jgi:hypothetical protein
MQPNKLFDVEGVLIDEGRWSSWKTDGAQIYFVDISMKGTCAIRAHCEEDAANRAKKYYGCGYDIEYVRKVKIEFPYNDWGMPTAVLDLDYVMWGLEKDVPCGPLNMEFLRCSGKEDKKRW